MLLRVLIRNHFVFSEALVNYPKNGLQRNEWLFAYPSQPVLTVDQVCVWVNRGSFILSPCFYIGRRSFQIIWTHGAMRAIQSLATFKSKSALTEYLDFGKKQIDAMVELVRAFGMAISWINFNSQNLVLLDLCNRCVVPLKQINVPLWRRWLCSMCILEMSCKKWLLRYSSAAIMANRSWHLCTLHI